MHCYRIPGVRFVGLILSIAATVWAGEISGQVQDPSGAVIVGVHVLLIDGEAEHEVSSNDRGDFVFTGVEPGEYRVAFVIDGFRVQVRRIELVATTSSVSMGNVRLDVLPFDQLIEAPRQIRSLSTERKTGTLIGKIVTRDGKPLLGASVAMDCGGCEARTVAGDGSFQFENLAPGMRNLRIRASGHFPLDLPIEAIAGMEMRYQLSPVRCPEPTCDPARWHVNR